MLLLAELVLPAPEETPLDLRGGAACGFRPAPGMAGIGADPGIDAGADAAAGNGAGGEFAGHTGPGIDAPTNRIRA